MNREDMFQAFGAIEDCFAAESFRYAPEDASGSSERIVKMKTKRIISIALAAALVLALGVAAYAAWSIHASRQQEIREDLRIEESHADSYVEYELPNEGEPDLVLLSTVNDGMEQFVYVNISPVSEEEISDFPEKTSFFWAIPGTELGGFAAPQVPSDLSLHGREEIRKAVLEYSYDKESLTMTVECYLDVKMVQKAMEDLGTEEVPLTVILAHGDEKKRTYGPVPFTLTEAQTRSFDFDHAVYQDPESGLEIEIAGLELTPFSAVWKVSYELAESFHTPEADWEAFAPWSDLEDKVCIDTQIIFSDGSAFSTGGALTTPFEDGVVNLHCGWGRAIDINAIDRIVLGDLVLWQK